MILVAGYLLSYVDSRAIMDRLGVPDKGVDDIALDWPINDWLAKTNRLNVVCQTIGHVYSDCKDAEGVLLITNFKEVREDPSHDVDLLSERDKDKNVKRWLMEGGEPKEDSFRWMSFRDGEGLGLLSQGTRPQRNTLKGPWYDCKLTREQEERWLAYGKRLDEWDAEVTALGEFVERMWPPR